MFTAVLSQAHL